MSARGKAALAVVIALAVGVALWLKPSLLERGLEVLEGAGLGAGGAAGGEGEQRASDSAQGTAEAGRAQADAGQGETEGGQGTAEGASADPARDEAGVGQGTAEGANADAARDEADDGQGTAEGASADAARDEAGGAQGEDGASPEAGEEEAPGERRAGYGRVRLDAQTQRLAGLRSVAAEAASRPREARALGVVEDIAPLLALRARLHELQAEAAATGAGAEGSRREVERLRRLQREGAGVPQRELQAAQARLQSEQAGLDGLTRRVDDLRRTARREWGEALAEAALAADSDLLERLLGGQEALVLVSLPAGLSLPAGAQVVHLAREADRARARTAQLLSPAARSDPTLQGETFYFSTAGEGLRVGMRLEVWVPQGEGPEQGVSVPASAILWHEGRPWVYLQTGEEEFERRLLPEQAQESAGALFLPAGVQPGERVVDVGAQTLLSEELRWAIPEEDDD